VWAQKREQWRHMAEYNNSRFWFVTFVVIYNDRVRRHQGTQLYTYKDQGQFHLRYSNVYLTAD